MTTKQSDKNLKTKVPQRRGGIMAVESIFFAAMGLFGFGLVGALVGLWNGASPAFLETPAEEETVSEVGAFQAEFGLYERASQRITVNPEVAPIFTPSVLYWSDQIVAWADRAGVDPNLAATVMQIESCGLPSATSRAGAMGLFQVMPFHFEGNENGYDPDTNAYRGLNYLAQGLRVSEGHAGLAMAGYNGGHSVISRDYNSWANETQRYYRWGTGIYREASAGWQTSPTLENWYTVGGASLCAQAEAELGIR